MPIQVVWRLRYTAATFDPTGELRRYDLPLLGDPTMATSSYLCSWEVFVVIVVDVSLWAGGMLACMQTVLE